MLDKKKQTRKKTVITKQKQLSREDFQKRETQSQNQKQTQNRNSKISKFQ